MTSRSERAIARNNVDHVNEARGRKPIVLVGMMGAGKSTVGRRVARFLGLDFVDSDTEIERAAGMSIPDIFETRGEAEFRTGELRVISRILHSRPDSVIATGGGAFIDETTRENIRKHAISVWLTAELEILFERVSRRDTRPLLRTANPFDTLKALAKKRAPVYGLADVTVQSHDTTHDEIAWKVIAALAAHLNV